MAATTTSTAAASSTTRASAQGILQGGNPSHYDSSNPIVMFIMQAGIIIILCRLIHWPLSKIRQPRVIAEVISGIILGPSVMGHIPGFTDAIFPKASIPSLSTVANLGLILFLFLVGLETDVRFLANNWRVALSVSAAGMILPFAFGCAIAYGLYHEFRNDPGIVAVDFGTYLLFIGIAMAITAFPVLCRILTELKLLGTRVGVIVLSAGVGNDVVGWILLALCVALVNADSGLSALWVLLVAVGYVLFLVFAFRPLFVRFLERTGSLQKGPSQSIVMLTLLVVLASAFFTQIIGIHAIFGGFVVGLICPHRGGFAIKMTEKIEDLVGAVFLPLYFTLSGLSTNLGLLNDGTVWGYVVGIIAIAFITKVVGGAVASRFCGMLWRESFAIGVLMSCKGLVELIVLNIGLQAKILSTRTFTMFVVMALIVTFMTTPLAMSLYPPWYQVKAERYRRGEIDWEGNEKQNDQRANSITAVKDQLKAFPVRKLFIYLRRDGLYGIYTLAALLSPTGDKAALSPRVHPSRKVKPTQQTVEDNGVADEDKTLQVHGVRLMELTDRDSSVMRVSAADHVLWDPVVNAFRAFGDWHGVSFVAGVSVVPEHAYADTIVDMARQDTTDLLLLPWSESGSLVDHQSDSEIDPSARFSNNEYSSFVANILDNVSGHAGVLIDHTAASQAASSRPNIQRVASGLTAQGSLGASLPFGNRSHHLVLPFFGGEDDRLALRLIIQLAQNDQVTATIVSLPGSAATSSTKQSDTVFFDTVRESLPTGLEDRVLFTTFPANESLSDPSQQALVAVREELKSTSGKPGSIVVLGRRRNSDEGITIGTESLIGNATRQALGSIGSTIVDPENEIFASVLVLQAGGNTVFLENFK